MTAIPAQRTSTFSYWQLISFGILTTPLAMSGLVLVMFLPTFYAVEMGLGLGAVGAIFAFGRIFDVVTDPLIGNLSDETRSRWGPRRPWMVIGVPLYCLAVWMLLSPPEGAGLVYLAAVSAAFFLFYTVVDVPYSSVGLEVSPDVHERSYLAGSKAAFQVAGAIFAASIPAIFALQVPAALTLTSEWIVGLSLLGLAAFLAFVPSKNRPVTAPRLGLVAAARLAFSQTQFRYLVGCFFIVQSANALTAGLTVLYITHVIRAPELTGPLIGLLFLSTAVFLPLWVFLSKKHSKKRSWMTAIATCSIALAGATFLGEGDVVPVALVCVLVGASFGADAIMPTSMLADIVDAGETAGTNRLAGTCLAIKNALSKLTFIIPMGVAFPLLDLAGFAETGGNTGMQLVALTGFFAVLPILLRLLSLVVIARAPLHTEKLRA
ncbi:MFS transporter [Hoeflea sp.]|uniref:MFS transporter n=1 Tax=Hoeflea sp. TaxID=1940281 RepID=UPI003B52DA08